MPPAARRPTRQRRALTTVAAPGRIGCDGDRDLAEGLAEALRDARDRDVAESVTHPFHTYPARMHPGTARRLVELTMFGARPGSLLVDPFCGSGTTLVEARFAGIRAAGFDLSPLAVAIARAKTWTERGERRRQLRDHAHGIAGEVLAAGKAARRAGAPPTTERRPPGFDPNARNRRLAPWFAAHTRRELEEIAARIDEVRGDDAELAAILETALSAILYKVSFRASDTDPSKVERHVARGAPARLFAQRVDLLCAGLDDLARRRGPMPDVLVSDARRLADNVPEGGVTAIVTSPPYAGTYDYAETQRLRFDFLGIRHGEFDQHELGARRTMENTAALARWRADLADVLGQMAAALHRGGLAALVVGDSVAAGRAVHADDDVRGALDDRLGLVAWAWQERPPLGGAEARLFASRGKREHVLLLERR